MLPFALDSKLDVLDLYELESDGRFQLIRVGALGPVMIGYNYILFATTLAEQLCSFDLEGIRFETAVIWDRTQDIEHSGYQQAHISNHFSFDQINDVNLDGLRFFVMDNRYLFASPSLKLILESEFSNHFNFTDGLSNFGGSP